MKYSAMLPLVGSAAAIAMPKDLDTDDTRSIRNVAATIAHDTMAHYTGNTSSDPRAVGDVHDPYYWWVGGALWGMMVDYYHVTEDPSYNQVVLDALLAKVNLGPENNYLPPEHADEEGNDDLFFWGNAVLSAAEHNFPQPRKELPSWLDISKNVFKWLESRWDTKNCGGGIFWQILESNPNGLSYKNSISNGGFFQFAARLARATGDDSYIKWAETVWQWSWDRELIDHDLYRIYDGVDIGDQCNKVNPVSYTYLSGIYLYGAAVLANHTGKAEWSDRAEKLLDGASWFFKSDGVMFEGACEPIDSCFKGNADMSTFKGYLADLMWKSAVMMPSLQSKVAGYLVPTAKAAAQSCQGGDSNTLCGMKWTTGGYDGATQLGPQMNALGAVQGLLIEAAAPPMQGSQISRIYDASFAPVDPNRVDPQPTTTTTTTETSTSETPTPTETETPTPTTTTTTTSTPDTSSDASTSTPAPTSSSSAPEPTTTTTTTTEEPTSTSTTTTTTTTTSSSSQSTTFITSTTPTPTPTETPTETTETSTSAEGSEFPTTTSSSSTSCTNTTPTDITFTLDPEPTSESSSDPITTPPAACPGQSSYHSSSSQHSISTFFSMPNQTYPGSRYPSSGLTNSVATLPSPTSTDEVDAATGLTNHVYVAVAVAIGSVVLTWVA